MAPRGNLLSSARYPMHRLLFRSSAILVAVGLATIVVRGQTSLRLASRPNTVVWGELAIDRPAALEIRSGDTVVIDTISHQGSTQDEDPVTFLGKLGVARGEMLQDVLDFWASRPSRVRARAAPPPAASAPLCEPLAAPARGNMRLTRLAGLSKLGRSS